MHLIILSSLLIFTYIYGPKSLRNDYYNYLSGVFFLLRINLGRGFLYEFEDEFISSTRTYL